MLNNSLNHEAFLHVCLFTKAKDLFLCKPLHFPEERDYEGCGQSQQTCGQQSELRQHDERDN